MENFVIIKKNPDHFEELDDEKSSVLKKWLKNNIY
jgi:hypothetical protein